MTEQLPDHQPDMLQMMFDLQASLQVEAYGKHPGELTGQERIDFYVVHHTAGSDEMHEALDEIGWKPWATSKHFNEEAVKGELVDEFHFFMNRCLTAGMDAVELFEKYKAKRLKNIQRQIDGYDGVSTKCPGCHRALDDDAVKCHVSLVDSNVFCDVKYLWFFPDGKVAPDA